VVYGTGHHHGKSRPGDDMYVVLGATGNTGAAVAKKLLETGQQVRVVGRDAFKLGPLTALGAEAVVADVNDAETLTKAFAGAKGAYLMIPPQVKADDFLLAADKISDAIAEAVKVSGVSHVVVLSSIGAQQEKNTGPIVSLHNFEEKLKRVPELSALFLRPAHFMENLLMMIGLIQAMGFLAGSVRGDLKYPMIAARDVGEFAAQELVAQGFTGFSTLELLGQRDLSLDEAATVVGAAIGKPKLSYQSFPGFMVEQGLKQIGLPSRTAALMSEMSDALNEGRLNPQEPRSERNTTPTSIETFVQQVFLTAYHAKAAKA
jgi:uncharacterized protein YbjT (DUF2867 family)